MYWKKAQCQEIRLFSLFVLLCRSPAGAFALNELLVRSKSEINKDFPPLGPGITSE